MSIFETIAVHRGRAVFPEAHLERLKRAAKELGWRRIDLPGIPPDCATENKTGVVRIYVTAGVGQPGDSCCGSTYALFEDCEVGTDFPPVRIALSLAPYLSRPGGWKTGNYWQNVDALAAARGLGVEDVLLFNPSGALVCASMANIFLEIEGTWKTPALETGARDGAIRAWVKGILPVEETLLEANDVARCTGCFLTNSRVGVRAVCEVDGRAIKTDVSALQALYREQLLENS